MSAMRARDMTVRRMIPVFNDSSVIPVYIKITLSFPIVIEKGVNGIRQPVNQERESFFLIDRLTE